ncbi:hypothetical protein H0N95_02570 [Candidatus Micrarchaeota archaeon]|nr:hypothetical protein [Candidatus Micrarchaeota archaeon]
MILGRSEIIKRIKGIDEKAFENYFVRMSRIGLTELRFKCLKKLAELKKATVSAVLKELGENPTGGSYNTINDFFDKLKKESILKKQQIGKTTYWEFTEKTKEFAEYLKEFGD